MFFTPFRGRRRERERQKEQFRSRAGCEAEESTRTRSTKAEKKRDDTGQKSNKSDAEEPKSDKSPLNAESVQDAVIKHCEETEGNREIIADMSEGSSVQMEQWIQGYKKLVVEIG